MVESLAKVAQEGLRSRARGIGFTVAPLIFYPSGFIEI